MGDDMALRLSVKVCGRCRGRWAIDGCFGLVPEPLRSALWWAATPLFDAPVVTHPFEGYLECWHVDPNAVETTR